MQSEDIELLCICASSHIESSMKLYDRMSECADGSTSWIRFVRSVRLHNTIVAVGMFSMLEAMLKTRMGWQAPFEDIRNLDGVDSELLRKIDDYRLAINVLKHGRGRSYDILVSRDKLPFRIKKSDEFSFEEGDVSEVDILIDADLSFLAECSDIISNISNLIKFRHDGYIMP